MATTDNPPGMSNPCVGTKQRSPGPREAEAARARGDTQQPPLQPWASHSRLSSSRASRQNMSGGSGGRAARSARGAVSRQDSAPRKPGDPLRPRDVHEGRIIRAAVLTSPKERKSESPRTLMESSEKQTTERQQGPLHTLGNPTAHVSILFDQKGKLKGLVTMRRSERN